QSSKFIGSFSSVSRGGLAFGADRARWSTSRPKHAPIERVSRGLGHLRTARVVGRLAPGALAATGVMGPLRPMRRSKSGDSGERVTEPVARRAPGDWTRPSYAGNA